MTLASSLKPYIIPAILGLALALVYLYHPSPNSTLAAMPTTPRSSSSSTPARPPTPPPNLETATLGAGCFWCTQAVLERVKGVWEVTCGYMGGTVANPTYEQVCTGLTGHAEVVQVKFDPKVLPYEDLLAWFWRLHDPTTLNRQGADEGTQYRSVIFYYNDAQRVAAEKSKADAQKDFKQPIVTAIVPATPFYKAEDYHQEYFNNNSSAGYCYAVIAPKLDKLHLTEKPTTATDPK